MNLPKEQTHRIAGYIVMALGANGMILGTFVVLSKLWWAPSAVSGLGFGFGLGAVGLGWVDLILGLDLARP